MIKRAITKPPVTNIDKKHGTSSEKDAVDTNKRRLEALEVDKELPEVANFFSATVGPRHMIVVLPNNYKLNDPSRYKQSILICNCQREKLQLHCLIKK
jgi:hypothetical protein